MKKNVTCLLALLVIFTGCGNTDSSDKTDTSNKDKITAEKTSSKEDNSAKKDSSDTQESSSTDTVADNSTADSASTDNSTADTSSTDTASTNNSTTDNADSDNSTTNNAGSNSCANTVSNFKQKLGLSTDKNTGYAAFLQTDGSYIIKITDLKAVSDGGSGTIGWYDVKSDGTYSEHPPGGVVSGSQCYAGN